MRLCRRLEEEEAPRRRPPRRRLLRLFSLPRRLLLPILSSLLLPIVSASSSGGATDDNAAVAALSSALRELHNAERTDVVVVIQSGSGGQDVVSGNEGEQAAGMQRLAGIAWRLLYGVALDVNATRVAVLYDGRLLEDQITRPSPAVADSHKCAIGERLRSRLSGALQWRFRGDLSTPLVVAENLFLRGRKNVRKYLLLLTTDDLAAAASGAMQVKPSGVSKIVIGLSTRRPLEGAKQQQQLLLLRTPVVADQDDGNATVISATSLQHLETVIKKLTSTDVRGTRFAPAPPARCSCQSASGGRCCSSEACHCNLLSGAYECVCLPGFYGDGYNCTACPEGTFNPDYGVADARGCTPCPGGAEHESPAGSTSPEACRCKSGTRPTAGRGGGGAAAGCETIRCPPLSRPEHGYFVGKDGERSCDTAVNAACGVRCAAGFEVSGSSVRLCQQNGTWSGTQPVCKVKSCQPLRAPRHGGMKCSSSEFEYGTKCEFVCLSDHVLVGSARRTCLPAAIWSGLATRCRATACPPLGAILNGHFSPANCTQGLQEYGTTCRVTCNPGYELSGAIVRQCTSSGAWTAANSSARCTDRRPPELTCPTTLHVPSDPGAAQVVLPALPPPAQLSDASGVLLLVLLPSQLENRFPVGRHQLTYRAEDVWGNKAECSFTVHVEDREPPVFHECRAADAVVSAADGGRSGGSAWVSLPTPVASDNSGRPVTLTSSHQSGYFPVGTTSVTYLAIDDSGNNSTCRVTVRVVEEECSSGSAIGNGSLVCEQRHDDRSRQCRVTCDRGYGQAARGWNIYGCRRGLWSPSFFFDCSKQEPATFEVMLMTKFPSRTGCHNESMVNEILTFLTEQFQQQMQDLCPGRDAGVRCHVMYTSYKCSPNVLDGTLTLTVHYKMSISVVSEFAAATVTTPEELMSSLRAAIHTLESHYISNGFSARMPNGTVQTFLFSRLSRSLSCPPGHVLWSSFCMPCPKGTYHVAQSQSCVVCPTGTYQDSYGALHCTACPSGQSTETGGAKSAAACRALCPAGTFSASGLQGDQSMCSTCEPNYYQPERGQKSCLACPTGSVTLRRGASAIIECRTPCKPDEVSSSGTTPCFPCPAGSYQDLPGRTYCVSRSNNGNDLPMLPAIVPTIPYRLPEVPNEISVHRTDALPSDVLLYSQCFRLPCQNNATCHTFETGFYCECPLGFAGMFCELELDECSSAPCLNGGQCIDLIHDFACHCASGWTGTVCELEVDECLSSPCLNGGNCIDKPGGYECFCLPGFLGATCQEKLDVCRSSPCLHNGTCVDHVIYHTCICNAGFAGASCQLEIDDCDSQPCFNAGSCERTAGVAPGYRCHCRMGFRGELCEVNIDECASQPCKNNGECVDGAGGYLCKCSSGHAGVNCETVLSSNFVLAFDGSVSQYGTTALPAKDMARISVAVWIRTHDREKAGTIFSYADALTDNAFTLTNCNGLTLYVAGESITTDIAVSDGSWHHLAVTWQSTNGEWKLYVDGFLERFGSNLALHRIVRGGGNFVIAQEQDAPGRGFNSLQSFAGSMAFLNGWDHLLSAEEIRKFVISCDKYAGNLIAWAEFEHSVTPTVNTLKLVFCGVCPRPSSPANGEAVWHGSHLGSVLTYYCDPGYQLVGAPTRRCQVYSDWAPSTEPYCSALSCPPPPAVEHGYTELKRTAHYGDYARYNCDDGYTLADSGQLLCNASGQWQGLTPACKETTCTLDVQPPLLATTPRSASFYRVGERVALHCAISNQWLVGSSVLLCTNSGEWDHPFPACVDADHLLVCNGFPPSIENGYFTISDSQPAISARHLPSQNESQLLATYDCQAGYVLHGNRELACTSTWPSPNATCVPVLCPELRLEPGVLVESKTERPRPRIKLKCAPGYYMVGSPWMECTLEGHWNGTAPHCVLHECPRLPNVTNGKVVIWTGAYGIEARVYCDTGYFLIGLSDIYCLANGTWSDHVPACYPVTCRPPATIQYGNVSFDGLTYGSTASYSCDAGHTLVGPTVTYCLADRSWGLPNSTTSISPYCTARQCQIPLISYGKFDDEIYNAALPIGSRLTYRCSEGYKPSHDEPVVCQETGVWSGQPPTCQPIECPAVALNQTAGGGIVSESDRSVYKLGDVVHYHCMDGYVPVGPTSAVCLADSSWSSAGPECRPKLCTIPSAPANGSIFVQSAYYGGSVRYHCNPGFRLRGPAEQRCLANGTWVPAGDSRCERPSCSELPPLSNGWLVVVRSAVGLLTVSARCSPGFTLVGNEHLTCTEGEPWSEPFPHCRPVVVACSELPRRIANGVVLTSDTELRVNSKAKVVCNEGFRVHSSSGGTTGEIVCDSRGIWNDSLPQCVKADAEDAEATSCGLPPPSPVHGAVNRDGRWRVSYACSSGYRLVGHVSSRCTDMGQWQPSEPPVCVPTECPNPEIVANADIVASRASSVGCTLVYACKEGYVLTGGSRERVADSDGPWSGEPPVCERRCLGPLPNIMNGVITEVTGGSLNGSRAVVMCDDGFVLQPTTDGVVCSENGTWSIHIGAVCSPRDCGLPPSVAHGQVVYSATTYGSVVEYSCEEGYTLQGPSAMKCGSQSSPETVDWLDAVTSNTSNVPTCDRQVVCARPTAVVNGRIYGGTDNSTRVKAGDRLVFVCNVGYEIRGGAAVVTCTATGEWSDLLPSCGLATCTRPAAPPNGLIVSHDSHFKGLVRYRCIDGYALRGRAIRTCLASGDWSGEDPTCEPLPCATPPPIHYARYTLHHSGYYVGSTVTYRCNKGYRLEGNDTVVCLANRTWSRPRPTCQRQCSPPPSVDNSNQIKDDISAGKVLEFSCRRGFKLIGPSLVTCLPGGVWDSDVWPSCVAVSCPLLPGAHPREPPEGDGSSSSGRDTSTGRHRASAAATALWGDVIHVPCPTGHQRNGSSISHSIECDETGRWIGDYNDTSNCRPVRCPAPGSISGGRVAYNDVLYGSVARYECHEGHAMLWMSNTSGNSGTSLQLSSLQLDRTCQADGTWSGSDPECRPVSCRLPAPLAGGSFHQTSRLSLATATSYGFGAELHVRCHPGYRRVGAARLWCGASGEWQYLDGGKEDDGSRHSTESPICRLLLCPEPPAQIASGMLYSASPPHAYLASAIYLCSDGGSRAASSMSPAAGSRRGRPSVGLSSCSADGAWSPPLEQLCSSAETARPACGSLLLPPDLVMVGSASPQVGSLVAFYCAEGHVLQGASAIECRADGTWSAAVPRCQPGACLQQPAPPPHGVVSVTHGRIKSTAVYSCVRGYALRGDDSAECYHESENGDSSWIFGGPAPRCVAVDCGRPAVVINADANSTGTTHGSRVSYGCHAGYVLDGQRQLTCDDSGAWSPEPPRCRPVACDLSRLPMPEGGYYHGSDLFFGGTPLVLVCLKGWELGQGDPLLYCTTAGEWSSYSASSPATCRRVTCPPVSHPTNGHAVVHGRYYKDSVSFSCAKDFKLVGAEVLHCTEIGMWDATAPECKAKVSCELRGRPRFTEDIPLVDYRENDVAVFPCTDGFHGNISMTCRQDGTWSSQRGKCERIACGPPETDSEGIDKVIGASYVYKSWLVVLCSKGYQREGDTFITCQSDGTWSQKPKCVPQGG